MRVATTGGPTLRLPACSPAWDGRPESRAATTRAVLGIGSDGPRRTSTPRIHRIIHKLLRLIIHRTTAFRVKQAQASTLLRHPRISWWERRPRQRPSHREGMRNRRRRNQERRNPPGGPWCHLRQRLRRHSRLTSQPQAWFHVKQHPRRRRRTTRSRAPRFHVKQHPHPRPRRTPSTRPASDHTPHLAARSAPRRSSPRSVVCRASTTPPRWHGRSSTRCSSARAEG
jgi:hypothetical protein